MINILNKLPIPSLRHYCLFSFSLLSLVALYAYKVMYDLRNDEQQQQQQQAPPTSQDEGVNSNARTIVDLTSSSSSSVGSLDELSSSLSKASIIASTYNAVVNEPWCVWVLINFSYCCLILFSKIIQMVVFGKLRAVENQVRHYIEQINLSLILINSLKSRNFF